MNITCKKALLLLATGRQHSYPSKSISLENSYSLFYLIDPYMTWLIRWLVTRATQDRRPLTWSVSWRLHDLGTIAKMRWEIISGCLNFIIRYFLCLLPLSHNSNKPNPKKIKYSACIKEGENAAHCKVWHLTQDVSLQDRVVLHLLKSILGMQGGGILKGQERDEEMVAYRVGC